MAANSHVLLVFFLILAETSSGTDRCASDEGEVAVIPINNKCSPFSRPNTAPLLETVLLMAMEDAGRLAYLQSSKVSVPVGSGQQLQIGNYVVRVKVGNPGQLMFMVMDTSNDLSWVPCSNCAGCPPSTAFSPATSTTFQKMDCNVMQCGQVRGQACTAEAEPCVFNRTYGGDSSFSASLVQDSLHLALDVVPNFAFGCINAVAGKSVPAQGLLGLGRGPLSLISQTAAAYRSTFSYCLPSLRSYYYSGSLKLGPVGQPRFPQTTPLLLNPHRPSLYYVNLTGISVGRAHVHIRPGLLDFNPATGAGAVIDSGTVITRFVVPVYAALRAAYRARLNGTISSLGAFDTCFSTDLNRAPPAVTLHFVGLSLLLPMENTLIHSSASPLACLAMAAAPDNVNSVLNVIANLQQQNLRVFFDVPNSRVGFARATCN